MRDGLVGFRDVFARTRNGSHRALLAPASRNGHNLNGMAVVSSARIVANSIAV